MKNLTIITLLLLLTTLLWACEESSAQRVNSVDGDADSDADGDSDAGGDGDSDSDSDSDNDATEIDSEDCDSLLEITVRDFDASHPDMERADSGWGPVAGVLEYTLDADQKPIFSNPIGTHTWKTGLEDGILEKNCWEGADGEECYMEEDRPMFDGEESFYDWYHDTTANQRFDKQIQMLESLDDPNIYIYDTSAFFPLSPAEGFGETPAGAGNNFLFTTEIHLKFQYLTGQKFTFRGDDDLWIFVNGRMALDLGGLHLPFTGTIDFDAKAKELGISPGGQYTMDIFHAERHTAQSNFRIETNISCFISIVPE